MPWWSWIHFLAHPLRCHHVLVDLPLWWASLMLMKLGTFNGVNCRHNNSMIQNNLRSNYLFMLMGDHNYPVNQICSHSGSAANELAVLYIAPMVTVGRHSWGGWLSKRHAAQCFHCAPYSHDEVVPSILLAPSKEQPHLAAELMTDGRRRKLFLCKRPGPLALRSVDWTLSVGGEETPSHARAHVHREDEATENDTPQFNCSSSICYAADVENHKVLIFVKLPLSTIFAHEEV